MTTQEVANHYIKLENEGKWQQIQDELYSNDVVSIEPAHSATVGLAPLTKGLDAVKAKGKAWGESIEEMHSGYCTQPVVAGNYFTVTMGFDATFKGAGRMKTDEICIFEVRDGKIVSEQFFY
jgi:ketosteroid isomerase-like protein